MQKISAVILTKNSERLLEPVLAALARFDEVVILDNGSSDATLEIAARFANVSIYKRDFIGFGPLKRLGSSLARNDWIFSIDSDEVASTELLDEIIKLANADALEPNTLYSYDVQNYFGSPENGVLVFSCGWGSDRCAGLYNRLNYNYNDALVHEKIVPLECAKPKSQELKSSIRHYPYPNYAALLDKMQRYSTLFATQNATNPSKRGGLGAAIAHSAWIFVRNLVLQKGLLQGKIGFVIAAYNAQCAFWKYLKLAECNENPSYQAK